MTLAYPQLDDLLACSAWELRELKRDAIELLWIVRASPLGCDGVPDARRELPLLIDRIDRARQLRRRKNAA